MLWVLVVDAARMVLEELELWDLVSPQDAHACILAALLGGLGHQGLLEFWEVEEDLPLVPLPGEHLALHEELECDLVDASALVGHHWHNALAEGARLENGLEETGDRLPGDGPQFPLVELVRVAEGVLEIGLTLLWMETTG